MMAGTSGNPVPPPPPPPGQQVKKLAGKTLIEKEAERKKAEAEAAANEAREAKEKERSEGIPYEPRMSDTSSLDDEFEGLEEMGEGDMAHIASLQGIFWCIKHESGFKPMSTVYKHVATEGYPLEISNAFKKEFGEELVFTKNHNSFLKLDYLIIDMSSEKMLMELMKFNIGTENEMMWTDSITWKFSADDKTPQFSTEIWILKADLELGFCPVNMAQAFGIIIDENEPTADDGFWVDVVAVPAQYANKQDNPATQDIFDTYPGLVKLKGRLMDALAFSEEGVPIKMEQQSLTSKPRLNFAKITMMGTSRMTTIPTNSFRCFACEPIQKCNNGDDERMCDELRQGCNEMCGELRQGCGLSLSLFPSLLATLLSNLLRFWFKKSLMLKRAIVFGSFPTSLELRFVIDSPILKKKVIAKKTVELRYKTEALGVATTSLLQPNIQEIIKAEQNVSVLATTHVMFMCNRCKNITHPCTQCPQNPCAMEKSKRQKRRQSNLKATDDMQAEIMGQAHHAAEQAAHAAKYPPKT